MGVQIDFLFGYQKNARKLVIFVFEANRKNRTGR